MNDRYTMISCDCHAGAPWSVYREYLDPEYREDWNRWVSTHYGSVISDQAKSEVAALPVQLNTMSDQRRREYLTAIEASFGHLGNWDPDVRIRELDREGVAGEIVYCDGSQNNHPPFGVGFFLPKTKADNALRIAGCRAHNRWLAELCATNPGRHAGVALVPMDDVEATVAEIRWARENGLFGGILLPGLQLNADGQETFWHHPRYEPVWRTCAELGMPLNAHASNSNIDYGSGAKLVRGIENHFTTYRPFWFLLWAGVFERYPNLSLCLTESGGMQVLWLKAYLDYLVTYRRTDEASKVLTMKPSEYFDRQCYVGASAHASRAEIEARYDIGVGNLMWGSDYPHPEGTWPASAQRTKELFKGVPPEEVRLMIGGTAGRVYGFDMAKLQTVADRIGPSVADFE